MTEFHLMSGTIGFGLGVIILYLIRRDHLYLRDGIFWVGVASLTIGFGIWPQMIDRLAGMLGIAYPPTLLFLVAILVLLVRLLLADIALTRMRRDLRRLNQKLALLEADLPGGQDAAGTPRRSGRRDQASAEVTSAN